jgi:hypothetical protein
MTRLQYYLSKNSEIPVSRQATSFPSFVFQVALQPLHGSATHFASCPSTLKHFGLVLHALTHVAMSAGVCPAFEHSEEI